MTDQPDNPPAFPVMVKRNTSPLTTPREVQFEGMTLRDYFAGQTLATLPHFWQADTKARISYEMADAMLAERVK